MIRGALFTVLALSFSLSTFAQSGSFLKSEFAPSQARSPQNKGSLADIGFKTKDIPQTLFRDTYQNLSDSAYQAKLQGALERSPLMFMRSFVNTYYADLSANNSSQNLILCLGDLHPENFGFMKFGNDQKFVYNDIDDTGVCPLDFDILRYFTTIQLTFNDKTLTKELAHAYSEILSGRMAAPALPKNLYPKNLDQRIEKTIQKLTENNLFVANKKTKPLPESEKNRIKNILSKNSFFKNLDVLDINAVERDSGGSGGLKRYWVLVQNKKDKSSDILELKETTLPGTSYGSWEQPLWSPSERLEQIVKYVWGENPHHFGVLTFDNANYLIRSRDKDSVDLDSLKKSDLRAYLMTQVGIIASYHRNFVVSEIPQLESWIEKNSQSLAERYSRSFKAFK